ncbi:aminopeptidase P family protein [Thermosipho ferrireducens]|uniref:Aminopeptidase P family protein n=1 Tax=Thermosipho ferrireducens TaxID=2571116 RepID=A0ABX7S5S0_9BACT|nr:aminopeptidase P family protein [Thermosipho ferrireducens]QTA37178.1 aminopeptidase P family protein [Thermosipho ferrireducens]
MKNLHMILDEHSLDNILIINIENSNSPSTRFFSGFSGSFSGIIFGKGVQMIITDSRYWEQVKLETNFDLVKLTKEKKFLDLVSEMLEKIGAKKVGIEKNRISASIFEQLQKKFNGTFVDISKDVIKARSIKSSQEIENIKKAVYIAEEAFKKTLEIVKPGITEKEFSAYLEYQMKLLGAEKAAFDTIVASGWRGALPHGIASDKEINKGEPVVVDWGAFYKGYVSDLTRVFCIGEPSEKVKEVHQIVVNAQEKAISKIKAGMTGKEIDSIARNYIIEKGFGNNFGHSLGHGIGLEVHEEPGLSINNEHPLPHNSIVTVEPGIYISNEFGIRIEDNVLVKNDGCDVLSSLSKDIFIV